MQLVSIDFVAGCHGNFLEYMCNKFIAKLPITFSPFNNLGASHIRQNNYYKNAVFIAKHYSELSLPTENRIVKISYDCDDLLPLTSVCFLRAGNSNIPKIAVL